MKRVLAYSIHVYTSAGIVCILFALQQLFLEDPDPRIVFLWLAAAVFLDSTDGPLARACDVENRVPEISGRTIDDIVDYCSFTFVPMLLVWRMNWLPGGEWTWVLIAPVLMVSLLGFANTAAKHEEEGFFLGFPSYWNIYAFYAGILAAQGASSVSAVLLIVLAALTPAPIRFLYPNRAPYPWRKPLLLGAVIWSVLLLVMLPSYPSPPGWLLYLSLIYPAWYVLLSIWLDRTPASSPAAQDC